MDLKDKFYRKQDTFPDDLNKLILLNCIQPKKKLLVTKYTVNTCPVFI